MEGYTVLQRKKYLKSALCMLLLTPLQVTPHTDKNNAPTEKISLLKSAAGFASAGLTITLILAGFCTYNRDPHSDGYIAITSLACCVGGVFANYLGQRHPVKTLGALGTTVIAVAGIAAYGYSNLDLVPTTSPGIFTNY